MHGIFKKGLESYDCLIYLTYLQNQGRFFFCNFMARKNIYNKKKIIGYLFFLAKMRTVSDILL